MGPDDVDGYFNVPVPTMYACNRKNLIRRYHVGSTLVAHCNRLEVGNLRFTNVGGLGPGLVSGIG